MNINQNPPRFERGAALLFLSAVLVKIIGALFKIPLSNLLGNDGFGYFSSAYDLFLPFYTVAMSGLPVAAARLIASAETETERQQKSAAIFRSFAVCGWVLFGLFFVAAPFILRELSVGYRLLFTAAIAPAIPLFFRMSAYRGVDQGNHKMAPTALSDLTEALGKLIFGYGFAATAMHFTKSVSAAAVAALFGITVGVLAADVTLALLHPKEKEKTEKTFAKELLFAAAPAAWTALVIGAFMAFADAVTVRPLLSENATALYGLRSKAYTLHQLVPTLTTAIGVGLVPAVAKAAKDQNGTAVAASLQTAFKAAAAIAVPAGIGLCAMAQPIMELLYGADPFGKTGADLLRIYGVSAIFAGLCVPLVHTVQALGSGRFAARLLTAAAGIKVLLNGVLVPLCGICGAAISTAVAFAVIFGGSLCFLVRNGWCKNLYSWLWRPFAASVGCVAVGFLPQKSTLATVAFIAVAAAVYLLLIWGLHLFSAEEIAFFTKKEPKNRSK